MSYSVAGIWNIPPKMAFSNFLGSCTVQVTSVGLALDNQLYILDIQSYKMYRWLSRGIDKFWLILNYSKVFWDINKDKVIFFTFLCIWKQTSTKIWKNENLYHGKEILLSSFVNSEQAIKCSTQHLFHASRKISHLRRTFISCFKKN